MIINLLGNFLHKIKKKFMNLQKIKEAKELLDSGVITQSDFEKITQNIINEDNNDNSIGKLNVKPEISKPKQVCYTVNDALHSSFALATLYKPLRRVQGGFEGWLNGKSEFFPDEIREYGGGDLKIINRGITSIKEILSLYTDSEIKEITSLNLSNNKIKSFKGIEMFSNLNSLNLDNNELIDVPIEFSNLPYSLDLLSLKNNKIKILGTIPNCNKIDFEGNIITLLNEDFYKSYCKHPCNLTLRKNPISDLSILNRIELDKSFLDPNNYRFKDKIDEFKINLKQSLEGTYWNLLESKMDNIVKEVNNSLNVSLYIDEIQSNSLSNWIKKTNSDGSFYYIYKNKLEYSPQTIYKSLIPREYKLLNDIDNVSFFQPKLFKSLSYIIPIGWIVWGVVSYGSADDKYIWLDNNWDESFKYRLFLVVILTLSSIIFSKIKNKKLNDKINNYYQSYKSSFD